MSCLPFFLSQGGVFKLQLIVECLVNEKNMAHCECARKCPEPEAGFDNSVCSNQNETFPTLCHLYRYCKSKFRKLSTLNNYCNMRINLKPSACFKGTLHLPKKFRKLQKWGTPKGSFAVFGQMQDVGRMHWRSFGAVPWTHGWLAIPCNITNNPGIAK